MIKPTSLSTPSFIEQLSRALTSPTNGVIGLVDDLLAVSGERNIRLNWHEGACQVSVIEADSSNEIQVPVQKSVVRAALARIAALCNERNPNSVLPYGGEGELTTGLDPSRVVRVRFVNTLEEQSLELDLAEQKE